jgi:hypothetical protein
LSNERVSIEAKEHAREILLKLNDEEAHQELGEKNMYMPYHRHRRSSYAGERPVSPQNIINVARGYKAYDLSFTLCFP